MTKNTCGGRILYVPDSPNVGDAPSRSEAAGKDYARNKKRADELAADVAVADELSAYETVAGKGTAKR